MNEVGCKKDICCSVCENEPLQDSKRITVYTTHMNRVFSGLPKRTRRKKGQPDKVTLDMKTHAFDLVPVEVHVGPRCYRRRWTSAIPVGMGLILLAVLATYLTQPPTTLHFVLTLAMFLGIVILGLIKIYDPDEFVVRELNKNRHKLERYKVYFTRRSYLSLKKKKASQENT